MRPYAIRTCDPGTPWFSSMNWGNGNLWRDGSAQSIIEYIHGGPRLFATHYRPVWSPVWNTWLCPCGNLGQNGRSHLPSKIEPGPADKSYGITLLRLLWFTRRELSRADKILTQLENQRTEVLLNETNKKCCYWTDVTLWRAPAEHPILAGVAKLDVQ